MKRDTIKILAAVAFMVIMATLILAVDKDSGPYVPDKADAYIAAKQFVERSLKAPSTADFASLSESLVSNTDGFTWEVQGYVDSQNAFGAMIRTKYKAKVFVDRQTKEWGLLDLQIE
jgi:hypothetical protein